MHWKSVEKLNDIEKKTDLKKKFGKSDIRKKNQQPNELQEKS